MSDVTLMLDAISRGDCEAAEELLPVIYGELRKLAAIQMANETAGHTLQPTALVHEAWLRLVGHGLQSWQNRAHFYGAAAEAMRRILIESARRKSSLKRGGGLPRVDISEVDIAAALPDDQILLVNEALEWLEKEDPETARIVTLKFFGGLTNEEVAKVIGTSERTVRREWTFCKAWLYHQITQQV
jgi:RNA polymerase sigma factor (TIGR02999 family)